VIKPAIIEQLATGAKDGNDQRGEDVLPRTERLLVRWGFSENVGDGKHWNTEEKDCFAGSN
jgi:hypothetical protein